MNGMNGARLVLSLLGIALVAAMPFVTASCGKKACLRWTEAEGACPSQEEAEAFFGGTNGCATEIDSVDSEADYDGELCCYDITERGYELCTAPVPGGPSSSVGASGPATSSSVVTTGTGPVSCDGTGDCGDGASGGCVQCAVDTDCAGALDACLNEPSCSTFAGCMDACGPDQACIDACAAQEPLGAQLYNALFDCVVCEVCLIDCANSGFVDPIPGCQ